MNFLQVIRGFQDGARFLKRAIIFPKLHQFPLLTLRLVTGETHKKIRISLDYDKWYARSKPFLDPKQSKDEYLWEFMDAWSNIKFPLQKSAADVVRERDRKAGLPPGAVANGLTGKKICLMIAWCRELQLLQGDEPFFLSPDTVKQYFKRANHSTAAYWLGGPCKLGILTKVAPGKPESLCRKISVQFGRQYVTH
jgi:hypothetical protein